MSHNFTAVAVKLSARPDAGTSRLNADNCHSERSEESFMPRLHRGTTADENAQVRRRWITRIPAKERRREACAAPPHPPTLGRGVFSHHSQGHPLGSDQEPPSQKTRETRLVRGTRDGQDQLTEGPARVKREIAGAGPEANAQEAEPGIQDKGAGSPSFWGSS